MNELCTFVMLVNYYYIFGLKKALATALFLQKIRLIHNQHKPNNLKPRKLQKTGAFLFLKYHIYYPITTC
jgi:hypothetical protein